MRFISVIFAGILVSSLFVIGAIPATTNATVTNEETPLNNGPFQASYLSMSITPDKTVYLTGETVNITVSTSAINTHIHLQAQLADGSQVEIANFTTNYSHTVSWTAPSTPGQIRFTCQGEALAEVWDYCTRYVCFGDPPDCHWDTYPCLRSITITGNASNDIRVFSRVTSISGHITDTNQRPVPGATVYLSNTAQSTTSNNDGYYEFGSYELEDNFALLNQIPTVTETVSVEAVACEPQPGKTIQVQADHGASDVNFILKRSFYPADIDLSQFTLAAFTGWPAAAEYSTWQNILGVTIDGPVQPTKLLFGTKEIPPLLFNIGDKKLYLVTNPEFGRYFLEVQGTVNTQYTVAAAATLNGIYLQPITTNGTIASKEVQRTRVMLEPDQLELKVIKPFPLLLIIIPAVVVLLGGLAAAYFLTGRKWLRPQKASTGRKRLKTKEKAKALTSGKSTVRKTKKK